MANLKYDPKEPVLVVAANLDRSEYIHPHMFGESCERQGLHEPASVFNYATRYLMAPGLTDDKWEGKVKYAGLWFGDRIAVATDRMLKGYEVATLERAYDKFVEIDKVRLISEIAMTCPAMLVRMRARFKSESPLVDPSFGMFSEEELEAISWALWIERPRK